MISDVFSDAAAAINDYLERYPEIYGGALRDHIVKLRDEMTTLQLMLDTPPSAFERLGNLETTDDQLEYAHILQQARELGAQAKEKGWKLVLMDNLEGDVCAFFEPRIRTAL